MPKLEALCAWEILHSATMVEVVTGGHSGHEVIKFQIFGDGRKTATKSSTLDMEKSD